MKPGQNRRFDDRPVMYDQRVVETEGLVATNCCCCIAPKVATPERGTLVVLSAIDLKDDAAVENEVDSAHAVNPHLTLQEDTEAM